jgi:hypothetical protein
MSIINQLSSIQSGERFILENNQITVQPEKSYCQWITGKARLAPILLKINEYIKNNQEEILKATDTEKGLKKLEVQLDRIVNSYNKKHGCFYLALFGRNVESECTNIKNSIQDLLKKKTEMSEINKSDVQDIEEKDTDKNTKIYSIFCYNIETRRREELRMRVTLGKVTMIYQKNEVDSIRVDVFNLKNSHLGWASGVEYLTTDYGLIIPSKKK